MVEVSPLTLKPSSEPSRPEIETRRYLGDGLYVGFDGFQFVLSAENGIRATDTVYLDPHVLKAFFTYVKDLEKAIEAKGHIIKFLD